MKKRLFLLSAILTAALLLQAGQALACEHYPDVYTIDELILTGRVEPQVGVPGYSGDYCCPDPECGEVCIPGHELPAKQEEAPLPAENDDPQAPAGPQQPEGPQEPAQGQEPTETGSEPAEGEKPADPPQVAPDKPAPKKPKTTGKAAEKEPQTPPKKQTVSEKKKTEETELPEGRFSRKYPWRRVRFRHVRKVRAEAAGELLWKAPSTPFQSILTD